MSIGILARMNEIARETIQLEIKEENFNLLINRFTPQENPRNKVVNLICHEILEKIHKAFMADQIFEELKHRQKTLPHPEGIFYTDVEKSVERAIQKLNIQFKVLSNKSSLTKEAVYPRVNGIWSTIFSFFKF
jgi:hypothetical protein